MRRRRLLPLLAFALCSLPSAAWAQDAPGDLSSSLQWFAVVAGLALVPFLLVMVTSFVKVVVVLGILRSALGMQGVPPMQIIVGLALILTLFVMAPVGLAMVDAARGSLEQTGGAEQGAVTPDGQEGEPAPDGHADAALSWQRVSLAAREAVEPLRGFLAQHAHRQDVALFVELSADDDVARMSAEDLLVLTPAFVVSELKEAFQIGFLLFIPFLVIDLVVANILMSLGMVMLSPTTVSLPFKLMLFVLVDGWYLLARGLVSSYQVI